MAITKFESDITFASASSITVNSNTQADSDAFTPDATCVALGIIVDANNAGTPASGDWVDLYWKCSLGNVDGSAGDDWETDEHAMYLGRLNTFGSDTPGEDPARKFFELPVAIKSGKLSYKCNQAATRNIVLRARVLEQRAA